MADFTTILPTTRLALRIHWGQWFVKLEKVPCACLGRNMTHRKCRERFQQDCAKDRRLDDEFIRAKD